MMRVNIIGQLLNKLNVLSSEFNIEVSGYLTGEIRDGEIYLDDVLIPTQSISTGGASITSQGQIELRRKYGVEKVKRIIGHWHSHHSMGCGWSEIDETNMNNIMEYKDVFVFIVSSRGNHLVRISVKSPLRFDINECELYLKTQRLDILRDKMYKLIETNQLSGLKVDEDGNKIDKEVDDN